ncbi:TIGR02710 family CRISPR-associated protein [Vineibacter terrae]|uniref:TIGR02710 family CRISPR-associated protein n=1 Tax=Vineibacter terrae TaxID=2586908 RepID=A0A5C8PVC2_9HYPH|nr:TIGR02710 family CRISPR-associated CARF protein [Vineibacter terrae]TXL82054.1 TIGR02710 family CRISPR-associated protein [Vineibacter terrae]
MGRALVLTVGTGDRNNLEGSLLAPLRKSIETGEWDTVVLLTSTLTAANAAALDPARCYDIRPLPQAGLEDDADACFRHFDAVIETLRRGGCAPQDILVDFTRGTKAMSAALVLAAMRHELPRLRYITGERSSVGSVVPGAEIIREVPASKVADRRRVDLACGLMRQGAFTAAADLLPDPDAPLAVGLIEASEIGALRAMRAMARAFAAWDRLDYRAEAVRDLAIDTDALPAAWKLLVPPPSVRAWIRTLADQPDQADSAAMARWLRLLSIDLLANAGRRVRHGQFEDALVRAYRVLELVGQARLFDLGIDSSRVPADDPDVIALRQRRRDISESRGGTVSLAREAAASLLKQKKDPLAQRLLQLGNSEALGVRSRNLSVLNHGFTAQALRDHGAWRRLLETLEDLLRHDHADDAAFRRDQETVRFLDFAGA